MKKVISQIENKKLVNKRHAQIFKAALSLFSRKGYHKATMREIAKASKINLSYLYKYISTKDDVLYIFYDQLHNLYKPRYEKLGQDMDLDPVQELKELISDIFTLVHKNKSGFLTMYTETRHLKRDSLRAVLSEESDMIKSVEQLILRGVEQGRFKTDDPFMAANIIQYLLVIEPLRGWNFKQKYSLEAFVDSLTAFIMKALGVPHELWGTTTD